jgi:predicted lipoprotein
MSFGRLPLRAVCALACVGLASCVPWTVRPIDEETSAATNRLSPSAYVDASWDSRVLPKILGEAVDASTLLRAIGASPAEARAKYGRNNRSGSTYFIVKGEGRVLSVTAQSRNRVLFIDIPPYDQRPDLSLQVGPVLRGMSLRDATGAIDFSEFRNQLEFADVGKEINSRILKTVLRDLDVAGLKGKTVSFTGTAPAGESSERFVHDLVPVRLEVEPKP